MLAAVAGEMAVVVIDHRNARAHEPRDSKHGDAGAQREGCVGMAHVVEMAKRLEPGHYLRWFPVPAAEAAKVDATAARVREQDRVLRSWQAVERFERDRLQRH